jgi:hypothetical protein
MSEFFDYDSEEWKEQREFALIDHDNTCSRCGFTYKKGMHVHHTKGAGYSDEVTVLCAWCHAEHHNNPDLLNVGAYEDEDGIIRLNGNIVFDPIKEQEKQDKLDAKAKYEEALKNHGIYNYYLTKKGKLDKKNSKNKKLDSYFGGSQ